MLIVFIERLVLYEIFITNPFSSKSENWGNYHYNGITFARRKARKRNEENILFELTLKSWQMYNRHFKELKFRSYAWKDEVMGRNRWGCQIFEETTGKRSTGGIGYKAHRKRCCPFPLCVVHLFHRVPLIARHVLFSRQKSVATDANFSWKDLPGLVIISFKLKNKTR